ncbi:hypothetical protein GGI19_006132 [Coemansia pectinata]|uniref:Uncharacterized protein n=1 Tax=Coemansia pectinata TaxID=1052879 RepID=A0A9W8L7T9_9FUNG|nr:hypothetical protein GGI19_006132 [Coemansia pectinata]
MEFDGVRRDSQEYKKLLKPLLQVSHNFRAIALPLYCNYFKLMYLGHPTHHLSKELEIELDERTVYSGRALEALSRAPYDGCSFPLVRKLAFTLVTEELSKVNEDVEINLSRAETDIRAFVERIKQLAPIVSEIRVQPKDLCLPNINDHLVGYLASQLYQLVGRIDYDYQVGTTVPIWQNLDTIRNLTHIKYTSVNSDGLFLQSVRLNASTLQDLDIASECDYVDICGLIRNTDGSYVTYPCLLNLFLWCQLNCEQYDRVVSRDVVPFPSLQHLMIIPDYPFDDDVVFRGSADTLESLDLGMSSSVISMLRRLDVFTPASHPKL